LRRQVKTVVRRKLTNSQVPVTIGVNLSPNFVIRGVCRVWKRFCVALLELILSKHVHQHAVSQLSEVGRMVCWGGIATLLTLPSPSLSRAAIIALNLTSESAMAVGLGGMTALLCADACRLPTVQSANALGKLAERR
jgi:hypothetical protein